MPACVWLWARDPRLCNAPRHVEGFDPDRREGQIDLAAGVRCALGEQVITNNQIGELSRLTRDPEVALSALFARLVESREAAVGPHDILSAERTIVARRFGGQSGGYAGALGRGRATAGSHATSSATSSGGGRSRPGSPCRRPPPRRSPSYS